MRCLRGRNASVSSPRDRLGTGSLESISVGVSAVFHSRLWVSLLLCWTSPHLQHPSPHPKNLEEGGARRPGWGWELGELLAYRGGTLGAGACWSLGCRPRHCPRPPPTALGLLPRISCWCSASAWGCFLKHRAGLPRDLVEARGCLEPFHPG